MSRYYYSTKTEADFLNSVEIWWLKKYGYLKGGKSGGIEWKRTFGDTSSIGIEGNVLDKNMYVRFFYTITRRDGEKVKMDYKIQLTTTSCHFGGKRYWFVCPLSVNGVYCGRRVGVLYGGGDYYGCRHCYNLTYESRNLGGISKAAGQVISIQELERLESEVKRKFYAGNMTRKYKRFILKNRKSKMQLFTMTQLLMKSTR